MIDLVTCKNEEDFIKNKGARVLTRFSHQILTSIKGFNSVANLRKTMIYDTNIDLVNDNVYTKFSPNLSIRFEDIEQKLNSDIN